ncbi:hypothetical protein FHS94_001621 [Sphingomonas aerophila]|uniref:Uncharacterized protein n=1 Tax=Sphingomonas aerophila TaxID=1344948 RepID=A0A7W9EU50_9SPHN|nr:hypothetical protein [Sphingomonas aerophila]
MTKLQKVWLKAACLMTVYSVIPVTPSAAQSGDICYGIARTECIYGASKDQYVSYSACFQAQYALCKTRGDNGCKPPTIVPGFC